MLFLFPFHCIFLSSNTATLFVAHLDIVNIFVKKLVMDFVSFLSPFLQAQHLGIPHPLDYIIPHIYLQNLQLQIWGSH